MPMTNIGGVDSNLATRDIAVVDSVIRNDTAIFSVGMFANSAGRRAGKSPVLLPQFSAL